uniref:EF-hand domain-containing protein n=1 Tax=Polytomella parva TaxID=51329 RepID=A0A7S0V8N5_9CHLO|mmetsp:Transcript_32731/g.59318  ORF Transcript_32731/g.59318 Transcript_32731/m.59318 type:complete len:185 (+) Transcript_32731:92-646(+)|eukprot:CAMPEP_0175073030 /NCGR_PEP_ID=MMETSP0052_2-20121109/20290_1 /TAXON_ID=51329 ORGANISM="Polytomella parva, Strain SAG 63-3" /NCGR_SAMPLE_ID=MMETSP0052_2 /ASSEMBLY_ACC=CAM_ASM_000194 /LENGTH=184 /DNA_ID=CAMNT_0016340703 /DNA_START=16 /DNA_END=570 /DNA_ORIENTATION=+
MASAAARERYARKNEQDELERAFNTIDKKGDRKIDPEELTQLFQELGHVPKRGEVEDMIWEVDEDCDNCISWLEFQTLYTRCRDDKTGYEPRGLFNVVEFVMNDKYNQGFITLEEAMQIMYLRYGRAQLDMQLEEVFGTADLNSGKILTLSEFLSCLHMNQVKQLLNRVTAKTYKAPPPPQKKK